MKNKRKVETYNYNCRIEIAGTEFTISHFEYNPIIDQFYMVSEGVTPRRYRVDRYEYVIRCLMDDVHDYPTLKIIYN